MRGLAKVRLLKSYFKKNKIIKILYFRFFHSFSCYSVAHIDLILSLRVVSMETKKKSTFKVLFYLKKNAPKKNGMVTVIWWLRRVVLFVLPPFGTYYVSF